MSIKSDLSFSQTTQNALQEAAALFRQDKAEDAYHVLHENVFLPQAQGKLTKAQADAVYRSMIPDPLSAPETPFSKRSCIPAIALRGHALKDLVAHYDLPEGDERSCILKAATILETEGDEEKAWKILHKALLPSDKISDAIIKEVHRVMIDSLRTPTSSFLQKHVKDHPTILEDNLLRAETLECLSTHFFDKEVVEGAKVQLDSPILEFRAKTREALQQAAQLFRERRIEEANELLKDAIWAPYEKGELTGTQVDIVYKTLQDPYDPQTEFAKRQFHSLFVLRAQALRDAVNFYSKVPSRDDSNYSWEKELTNTKVKEAVLKAASLIEEKGDMEGAWKILNDVLPSAMREQYSGITDEFVKEVYRIMNDSLRIPASTFLKKRIQENPSLIDENRLRAMALESLSIHIFDDEAIKGEMPQFKVFEGTEKAVLARDFAHLALPHLGTKELATFRRTSKPAKETVIKSIKNRNEVSWKELKQWRKIGIRLDKDTLSGVRVINKDGLKDVSKEDLQYFLSLCGEHVEVLDFGPRHFKRDFLAIVGKHCPNLLSFIASNSDYPVDAKELELLASGCPKLQNFIFTDSRLLRGSFAPFAKHCPGLRRVDISGAYEIIDSDIEALASGCKMLTDFHAERISLGDGTLKALGSCPLLKSLKLSHCKRGDESNFSVEGMKAFVRGCKALEELSLKMCLVRDDVLVVIGEAGLPLTKITIPYNNYMWPREGEEPLVTSAGILSLIRGYPQVRELDVSNNRLEDNDMEAIAKHCPLVTKLVAFCNGDISLDGVQAVASKCTLLNHLEIGGSAKEGEGYLKVLTDSPCMLASIDFTHSPSTTAEEMIAFVRKNTGLRHIRLPVDQVTDEVLFAIAASCPLLESLVVGDNVTANGIRAIGRGCPHFKWLKATHRKAAGNEFLKAIGESCPELTYLDISYGSKTRVDPVYRNGEVIGTQVIDAGPIYGREGYIALGKGCRKLSELLVSNCHVHRGLIEVISEVCPSLKRIDCTGNTFDAGQLRSLWVNCPEMSSIIYTKGYHQDEELIVC